MDNIYSDPDIPSFHLKRRKGAGCFKAAGAPCRYALALLSGLYLVLLGGLVVLGLLNIQNSNRSDYLEKENRNVAVSLSAMKDRLNECCTENFQPVQSGMKLRITGTPKPNPARFTIDVGQSVTMIALHLDVYFNYFNNYRNIILNSFDNGCWEEDKWISNFPFVAGREFQVTIFITSDNFLIDLPEGNRIRFPNRLGEIRYDYLLMKGDVEIQSISME